MIYSDIKKNKGDVLSMGKTPEYTKKAINNYREKFDFIQVRFPKGTKERLKDVGNINNYIVKCVLDALNDSYETKAANKPEKTKAPTPKKTPEISGLYEIYKGKLHEFVTQLEIQEKYGNDVLLQLSDYAKKADQVEDNPGE